MMTSADIRSQAREDLQGKWVKGVLISLLFAVFEILLSLISTLLSLIPVINIIASIGIYAISIPITFGLTVSFIKLKRGEDVAIYEFILIGYNYFIRAWAVTLRTALALIVPIILVVVTTISLSVTLVIGTISITTVAKNASSQTTLYTQYEKIYSQYQKNPTSSNYKKLQEAQSALDSAQSSVAANTSSRSPVIRILTLLFTLLTIASYIFLFIKSLSYVLANYIAYDNPQLSAKEAVGQSAELMQENKGKFFVLGLTFIGWALLSMLTIGIGLLWLLPYFQVSFICFYEYLMYNNQNYIPENM